MENANKNTEKRGGTPAQSYAAWEEIKTIVSDLEDWSWTKYLNRFCLSSWSMEQWINLKLKRNINKKKPKKKQHWACNNTVE